MDATRRALIIGNGFDLNLGLKTSYQDFMEWLQYKTLIQSSHLYEHLKRKVELNRWVDIEDELRNYSSAILENPILTNDAQREYIKRSRNNFRNEYLQVCALLRQYLKEQESAFDLSKVVDSDALNVLDIWSRGFTTNLQVISFNYTTFLDDKSDVVMHHVHGALDKDDFVFGIEDGEDINKQHSFLYKSHNQGLNVNHLNDKFDDAQRLTFFGYSLGQTDHSYFDDFFKQQSTAGCKRKIFDFYYYGQDAYDDLYWQLRTLTDKRVAKFKQFNDVNFINIKK